MAGNLPKVSVVVPTYNEELAMAENIRAFLSALQDLQKKIQHQIREWELVLVNDGSTDKTLSLMEEAAKTEPRIKIVSYLPNRGRGHAIKKGIRAATGDYIIVTESDLTWGAEIIYRFVEELNKNEADIIVASPHMKGGKMENVPFLRWALSYFGNKIFSFALPGKFTMVTGMTRAYRREVLDSLDLESDDKELHVEMLYKALDLGFKVKEIPATLRWKQAKPGQKVRKSHFKLRMIASHLLLSFFVRPFLLFGTSGLFLIGLGAAAGFYLLVVSFSGTPVAGRPLLVFAALSIIVGIQILAFGFLASQNRALKRQLSRIQGDIMKNHGTKGQV